MKYITTGTYSNGGIINNFCLTTRKKLTREEMKDGILASDQDQDFELLTYTIDEQD